MIEMTLSSRHSIRNSSPGGLRPSTLPLSHGGSPQYWLSHVDGEETCFVSFKPPRPRTEPRTLAWKVTVLTATLGPPPILDKTSAYIYRLYFTPTVLTTTLGPPLILDTTNAYIYRLYCFWWHIQNGNSLTICRAAEHDRGILLIW